MATIARGISKSVAIKKEVPGQWGELAGPTGAKYLRRVTASFNLMKESYESNEIRKDQQLSDFRHGIRSVEGSVNGELSPGSYADFMGSVVARDFTAGVSITGLSVTIAQSGDFVTVARSAGSWLTDGFKVGNVITLDGAGLNVNNADNNLLIASLSALTITAVPLSGTDFVPEGPIATVTVAVRGQVTYAPLTGHSDDSYNVEEYYSDINQSEVTSGLKVGSMAVQLPATGLVTVDFSLMGKNLERTGTTEYFTNPVPAGTDGIFAAVSGALIVNGQPQALITSMDFTVDRALEAGNVIGSNFAAEVFTGRIRVTGNFSTYFKDGVFRGYYNDEDVISLVVALSTGDDPDADVVAFTMPRVKLGSATKSDGESGVIQDHSFVALLNSNTATGLSETTIMIQDTSL